MNNKAGLEFQIRESCLRSWYLAKTWRRWESWKENRKTRLQHFRVSRGASRTPHANDCSFPRLQLRPWILILILAKFPRDFLPLIQLTSRVLQLFWQLLVKVLTGLSSFSNLVFRNHPFQYQIPNLSVVTGRVPKLPSTPNPQSEHPPNHDYHNFIFRPLI